MKVISRFYLFLLLLTHAIPADCMQRISARVQSGIVRRTTTDSTRLPLQKFSTPTQMNASRHNMRYKLPHTNKMVRKKQKIDKEAKEMLWFIPLSQIALIGAFFGGAAIAGVGTSAYDKLFK